MTENVNQEYTILQILTSYFGEDINLIFKSYPIGASVEEVEPLQTSPWIAELNIDTTLQIYHIFVEKQKCTTAKTVFEAIETILIFFFNFNMSYPKEISLTMQAIQMIYGIPDSFGRSNKKSLGNKSKVYSFLSAINKTN